MLCTYNVMQRVRARRDRADWMYSAAINKGSRMRRVVPAKDEIDRMAEHVGLQTHTILWKDLAVWWALQLFAKNGRAIYSNIKKPRMVA